MTEQKIIAFLRKITDIATKKPEERSDRMKCRFEWTQQMTYVTFTLIPALVFCFVYLGNMKVSEKYSI